MAYNIKRFDNTTPVVTVADNTIDNTTLAINLIGKNRSSYGEAQNQNFVYLLENFAGSEPPRTALSGQLWYNSANNKLSFNDGNGSASYRTLARLEVSNALPSANSIGDLWFNSAKKELTLWDGTRSIVIGPANSDPTTLIERLILKPRNSTELKNVLAAKVNDTYIYIISSETFEVDSVFNESNDNSLVYNQFPKLYAGITLPTANVFGMFTSNILLSSSTANNGAGTIRYNNGVFEGYNGSNWVNFGGIQGVVAVSNGGTGLQTYSTGDLIYASGSSTLAKRTIGTTGQVLTVENGIPTWKSPASGLSYPSGTGLVRVSGGSSWGTTIDLPNNADVYLNGSGAWSTPSSGPSGGISSINISGAGLSSNTLTSNGTLTLSGTLNTANGGTGTATPGLTFGLTQNTSIVSLVNTPFSLKIAGSDVDAEVGLSLSNTYTSGGITKTINGFIGAGQQAMTIASNSLAVNVGYPTSISASAFDGVFRVCGYNKTTQELRNYYDVMSDGIHGYFAEDVSLNNGVIINSNIFDTILERPNVRGLLVTAQGDYQQDSADAWGYSGAGIIFKNTGPATPSYGFVGPFTSGFGVVGKSITLNTEVGLSVFVNKGDPVAQVNLNGFVLFPSSTGQVSTITRSGIYHNTLGTGTVYSSSGTLTNTNPSDLRLKTNVNDISWGLAEIMQLRPVSFEWINDPINQGQQYGFIAQEVQPIMPELVREINGDERVLSLDKEGIYASLVKSIQEQQHIIEQQKLNIESLVSRIEQLEAIIKQ